MKEYYVDISIFDTQYPSHEFKESRQLEIYADSKEEAAEKARNTGRRNEWVKVVRIWQKPEQ